MLVVDFDSVRQADLLEDVGRLEAVTRLQAMLRTAALLSDEVLLTDSQLLDGAFFLLLGPDGVASALDFPEGANLPIRVVARKGNLEKALAEIEKKPGFEWSSNRAADLDATLGRPEPRRRAWVEAAKAGRLSVENYEGKTFPFEKAAMRAPVPPIGLNQAFARELRGMKNRSEVRQALRGRTDLETSLRQRTYEWWDDIYADALAEQHGAAWLSFGSQGGRRVSQRAPEPGGWGAWWGRLTYVGVAVARHWRNLFNPSQLILDGTMLELMGSMPSSVYGHVRFRAADAVARWRADSGRRGLSDIAFSVRLVADQTPRWGAVLGWALVRTFLILGLGVAAFSIGLVDPTMQNTSRWIGLSIAFVLIVPWSELRTLTDSRPGKLHGLLHRRPAPP